MTKPIPARARKRDLRLGRVFHTLSANANLQEIVGNALRKSFDEVIDGARTGRYDIQQLEKTEKTYIGTKVEIVLRHELDLERGRKLDNNIVGQEVDTKFSLTGAWMIPREAFGELCLLVSGNDDSGRFSIGLCRMNREILSEGANQDRKKRITKSGKERIRWLVENAPLPRNFLFDLEPQTRKIILAQKSGTQRLHALFKNVKNQIIPRAAVVQVAQLKGDPLKRAREAKAVFATLGINVLCATYKNDRAEFRRNGFTGFADDDWLAIHPQ